MPDLFHCGSIRKPHSEVTFKHPDPAYKADYEVVIFYEYCCPGCIKCNVSPWLYAWVGIKYDGSKTELKPIDREDHQKWCHWVNEGQTGKYRKKQNASTVEGSQKQSPYRFMTSVPVVR